MLAQNLKYLRKKKKISQQALANALDIPRTTLGDYERGKTEPNIDMLIRIAKKFDVTVDGLVRSNISHQDLEIIRNKDLRVLAISVDTENRQNIELVESKAEAGYLESFQDPEYIKELPKIYFPNIKEGTYRAFEIQGDSMLPMEPGTIVLCSFVEDTRSIKNNKTYVIASQGGLVYKRVHYHSNSDFLTAISDNITYQPYTIRLEEIAELWQYYAHLSFSDVKQSLEDWTSQTLEEIREDVSIIRRNIE
jgi:transcriptional regulator with XRE-family HTH domain